jgi:hypothetical protein
MIALYIISGLLGVLYILETIHIIHHVLFSDNNPFLVLACPTYSMCSDLARVTDMSIGGTVVTTILYTILIAPAVLAYYAILLVFLLGLTLFAMWCLLFRKRK